MEMNARAAHQFAEEWVALWNAGDLDGLLAHYCDDPVFLSPRAQDVTGSGRVEGKDGLRAYWGAAIARATSRHFTLDRALWDPEHRELVVLYTNERDGVAIRASEVFHFDADGLVDRAEALYGIASKPL